MESELEKSEPTELELREKIELAKAELERLKDDEAKLDDQIFEISNSIYEELVKGPFQNRRNRGILDQDLQGALNLLRVSRDELWVKDPVKGLDALSAWETQYKAKYELAKQVKETVKGRLGSSRIEQMLDQRKELENERRPLKKELDELESRYRDYLGSPSSRVYRMSG